MEEFDFFKVCEEFNRIEAAKTPEQRAEEDRQYAEENRRNEEERLARIAKNKADFEAAKCRKCNGHGRLDHYWYNAGGVCFSCNGTGRKW